MKRYNLSQIMKSAWRSYKRASNERTFSECLKSAWSLAKLQEYCSSEAVKARTDQFLAERHEAMSNAAKATMDCSYNKVIYSGQAFVAPAHIVNNRLAHEKTVVIIAEHLISGKQA